MNPEQYKVEVPIVSKIETKEMSLCCIVWNPVDFLMTFVDLNLSQRVSSVVGDDLHRKREASSACFYRVMESFSKIETLLISNLWE